MAIHPAEGLRRLPLLTAGIGALLLTGALVVVAGALVGLTSFADAGFPDSATLLRVGEFLRSGRLYPDLTQPPYLATLYGPLTYVLLAVPFALAQALGLDPVVAVRILVLAALAACVWLVHLITRRQYGSARVGGLCVLFAVSVPPLADWTAQVRGDLLAVALSLLSVWLFVRWSGRRQIVGAALCAAAALLVKQTALAAPMAFVAWLVLQRRYRDAALLGAVFAAVAAGVIAAIFWREPLALQHMAAIRQPLFDHAGGFAMIRTALWQPAVPFAALGAILLLWRRDDQGRLLVIYCVAAWLVAAATIQQVGGGFNYFWEPLLASAMLAGPGLRELQKRLTRTPLLFAVLLYLLLLKAFLPLLRQDVGHLGAYYRTAQTHEVRKARWRTFVATISGRRFLSTFPDLTLHSSVPEIPDPFLNSVLERSGTWDPAPVVARIDAGAYELIVIADGESDDHAPGYRGIRGWGADMWSAVKRSYRQACEFDGKEVWLPLQASTDIAARLEAIGCVSVSAAPGAR